MRRLRVALVVLALATLAAPAQAQAVSFKQAKQVAARAFKHQLRTRTAKVFALRTAVPAGTRLGQGVAPRKLRRLRRPGYVFWLDLAPGAGFEHPSVLLAVDKASGRIASKQRLYWWPVVNNRRLIPSSALAKPKAVARVAAAVAGFANDCIVTIGDRTDPYFLKGMAAVNRIGNKHGLPVAAARTVADLDRRVDELSKRTPPCTDVMIYIGAHGYAPPESKIAPEKAAKSAKPQVHIRSPRPGGGVKEEPLTSDDVRRVMERHPSLTFKLVVESCFSGRWTILAAQPNLRIILTSARANEVTFLAVTDPRAGFQKDGVLELSGSDLTTADGPDDPPPFTAGLDKALDEWAGDAGERAKGEELGKALGYAGAHRDGDKARTLGWQHGNTVDRTDERPHAPLPSTVVTFGVSVAGSYRHIGPGQSEACFVVQTSPARPDAEVHVSASGPGVVSQPAVAHTDASGSVRVRVPIDAYGTYQATATVTAGDGGQASGSGSVTVTSAAGTCPAP